MKRKLPTNKLKAFTIIETIVAMAIIIIVVIIAYQIRENSVKLFDLYQNQENDTRSQLTQWFILKQDIEKSETITLQPYGLCFSYSNDTVLYITEHENLLRIKNNITDTLKFRLISVSLLKETSLIEELIFTEQKEKQEYRFMKIYTPSLILNSFED